VSIVAEAVFTIVSSEIVSEASSFFTSSRVVLAGLPLLQLLAKNNNNTESV
jgi:hypothetical protein